MNAKVAILARSKTFSQAADLQRVTSCRKMARPNGLGAWQKLKVKPDGQNEFKVVASPCAAIIFRFALLSNRSHYRYIFSLSLLFYLLPLHTHFLGVYACEHRSVRGHARHPWTKCKEGQESSLPVFTRCRWLAAAVFNETLQSLHTTTQSPPSSPASPAIATREARLSQRRLGRLDRGSGPSRAIKRDFANKAFAARFHRPAAYFAFPTRLAAL